MTNSNRLSPAPYFSGMHGMSDEKDGVEVLLVGDGPQVFSLSQRQLERKGCRCHFAKSQRRIEELLNQRHFDIVLTTRRVEGSSTDWLGGALSGSHTTLFCVQPVEVGCWWVPVLRVGAAVLRAPALRPREFSDALTGIVDEIRASAAKTLSCEQI